MTGVMVRQANFDDAAMLAELMTELNHTVGVVGYPEAMSRQPEYADVSREQMAGRLSRAEGIETVLLAEVNGQPAGFISLRVIPYLDQDTPYAEVTQMHVRPAFRRRRVGALLIEAAEGLADQAGATCVHILTGEDNVAAQSFYRAAGYEAECIEFQKYLPAPVDSGGPLTHG